MTNSSSLYSVHHEPAWRDRANFIINAALPERGRFEQLWARQVTEDTFEVCCIPFFLYDVALGDVVRTSVDGERPYEFRSVVEKSGRYVFRVHFPRESLEDRDVVEAQVRGLGALVEWSSTTMMALDAEDTAHAQSIADLLAAQEGRLVFETGKTIQ